MRTIISILTEYAEREGWAGEARPEPVRATAYNKPAIEKLGAVAYKGGRCWNGAHRDAGTIYHWVPEMRPSDYAVRYRALCGATPGRRSYGWSTSHEPGQAVTCPRCLKKMAQNSAGKENRP